MKNTVKKSLAVLLCMMIIFSIFSCMSFAGDNSLSVFVASDTHFEGIEYRGNINDNIGMPDSELYFHTTIQGQMNGESEAIMRSFLDTFEKSDKKILLIPGDLTGGKRIQHKNLSVLFNEFEKRTGKKIFVINGNHDINAKSDETKIDLNEFKSFYNNFGYSEAIAKDSQTCSYAAELDGKYRLLAVDSCIYGKDDGKITKHTFQWIKEQISSAEKDGKKLVVMMHHSVLKHFGFQSAMKKDSSVGDFASFLADNGVKYVFTGHIHANDIAGAVSQKGNRIYDIMTGSLITCPNAYRVVTFDDNKTEIKTEYINNIDIKYLPDGYNKSQLDLLENNFSAFSSGYFEQGIHRWINEYLGSARKVAKLLKVNQGTEEYDKINKFMSNFKTALNLPIYEKDNHSSDKIGSVEQIAKSVGCEITQSDYKYFYEIAAKVMGDFYKGDENITSNSVEVKLLHSVLKSCLAHSFGNILGNNVISDSFKDVLNRLGVDRGELNFDEKITTSFAKVNYAKSVSNKIVSAVIGELIEGISVDYSSPGDLNVFLEGFSSPTVKSTDDVAITFINKMIKIFRIVISVIASAI